MSDSRPSPARIAIFAVLVLAIAVASAGYLYFTRGDSRPTEGCVRVDDATRKALVELRRNGHVAFRDMTSGPGYGHLSFAPLESRATRITTALSCNRVHFTAGWFRLTPPATQRASGYLRTPDAAVDRSCRAAAVQIFAMMVCVTRFFVTGDSYLASGCPRGRNHRDPFATICRPESRRG
jgi:hypothetical protein